ncbi:MULTISPECIES: sulfatase-like hydrolase/transferase [Aliiglaciecola]|uniref:sulfatase-like hydrolase/transferase n=1 Tax=Aliiglaciecola TaxID=1406885 RepID=UPI001C099C2E|nr:MULTISPECIES: sulfatase-like hydrolase/transferase [Aliiglaciecola]MBU2880334.1 sulfatase-like hydrolase/transferase [Aliiglaciecola lipolytica]MDO6713426.1 sulfatase-like hydrolase/transferase [Aliiglaciecola sp. 2_MG-2023]MDO6754561.1 sulfatase-like hydrolase/transferase [Aliiglaciecola sp. 1_MG-2023]
MQIRKSLKSLLMGVIAGLVSISIHAKQPNIVLILADDMGYECLSANGCAGYNTPVLDELAAQGVRFEHAFANPKCTQSRVKLMTGLYNLRNYKRFAKLDRSQTTFAHYLKSAGYKTAIAGKWQLGKEIDSPQHFGFDSSWLWQHTRPRLREDTKHDSRYPNPQLEFNGKAVNFSGGEYGPDVLVNQLTGFIERNQDQPFLLYYPMLLPHWPFDATPDSADWDGKSLGSISEKGPGGVKEQTAHFKDMVQYADKMVGSIIDKLDALGLRENTLIIFVGDNGTDKPITTQCPDKLVKGAKGTLTDAGTRVPLIINWPGVIQPKVNHTRLVELSDILPTLLDFTGIPLAEDYPHHGLSLKPLLLNDQQQYAQQANKSHIQISYKKDTWIRNFNYGVKISDIGKDTIYEKYNGHYQTKSVQLDELSAQEKQIFSNLQALMKR